MGDKTLKQAQLAVAIGLMKSAEAMGKSLELTHDSISVVLEALNTRAAIQPKEVPDYEAVAREIVDRCLTVAHSYEDVVAILKRHFPQQ